MPRVGVFVPHGSSAAPRSRNASSNTSHYFYRGDESSSFQRMQSNPRPQSDNLDILVTNSRLPSPETVGSPKKADEEVTNEDYNTLAKVEIPHTIFTKLEKLGIVLLVAFASMFSPLSSFIYNPASTSVINDLHTNLSRVNLTTTTYVIVCGIAPMILGSIPDLLGRRPGYLLMFFVYVLANVGTALQTSYPALLILRMLQVQGARSLLGSAIVSLAISSSLLSEGRIWESWGVTLPPRYRPERKHRDDMARGKR